MKTMTSSLYISNNGEVACPDHLGAEGVGHYQSRPEAETYVTTLDEWVRLDGDGFVCSCC